MAMAPISLLLLVVASTAAAAVATSRSPIMAPAPAPSSSATGFLRSSCTATKAPDVCYNLLLPYVDTFHGNLARVGRAASAIAGGRQHDLDNELAGLKLRGTGAGRLADMTLSDCSNEAARGNMFVNETLGHIDNLIARTGGKKDFDSEQFWARDLLDSAHSGLLQCVHWFHDAGEAAASSPVGKEVIAACTTVAGYVDIAFLLVNAIEF